MKPINIKMTYNGHSTKNTHRYEAPKGGPIDYIYIRKASANGEEPPETINVQVVPGK